MNLSCSYQWTFHDTSLNHICEEVTLIQRHKLKSLGTWACDWAVTEIQHRSVNNSQNMSFMELLYQNEFYSTIVCTTEQENVSVYVVLKPFTVGCLISQILFISNFTIYSLWKRSVLSFWVHSLRTDLFIKINIYCEDEFMILSSLLDSFVHIVDQKLSNHKAQKCKLCYRRCKGSKEKQNGKQFWLFIKCLQNTVWHLSVII